MTLTLTDTVLHTDGTPWVGATITVQRRTGSWTGDASYPPDILTTITDGDGEYTLTLWPNEAGVASSPYLVRYPNDGFLISLPADLPPGTYATRDYRAAPASIANPIALASAIASAVLASLTTHNTDPAAHGGLLAVIHSTTPAGGASPLADNTGQLAAGWLPAAIARVVDMAAADAVLQAALTSETTARQTADAGLDTRIDSLELAPPPHNHAYQPLGSYATSTDLASEASTRASADTSQQVAITALQASIDSLPETIDDRVAGLLEAGANISLVYDDAAGSLTIASTGGDSTPHSTTPTADTAPTAGPTGTIADGWLGSGIARSAAVTDHAALTTSAHGGIVNSSDARLSDARTPTNHAASHAAAGGDALSLSQSQVSGLVAALAALAPLASPALTGAPTAPTATTGTNTTQLATTAFVQAAIGVLLNSAPGALDTLNELAMALGNDPNFATTMTNALASKLAASANLSDLASAPTARGNLGLGTLALLNAITASQISDGTAAGRALLTAIDTAAQRTALGLGTAATASTTAFEAAGAVATHEADTTNIHGITDTTALLTIASALNASNLSSGTVAAARLGAGTPSAATFLRGDQTWAAAPGSVPSHAYYVYAAAALEPLALIMEVGTFTRSIAADVTELLIASWSTRLGASGRMEVRNPPMGFVAIRGQTLVGLASGSTAVLADLTRMTYSDAWTVYHDRLSQLATLPTKYVPVAATATVAMLPGPYGSIVTSATCFDATWLLLGTHNATINYNLMDEISDAATQRVGARLSLPIAIHTCANAKLGAGGSGLGGLTFVNCPASWGMVADLRTYLFRDDGMGAALNTATVWTRAQSAAGNVEIDSTFAWIKMIGNDAWGNNGLLTQQTWNRAPGRTALMAVYTGAFSGAPNLMVGWHDGSGQNYTDLVHGVYFTYTTSKALQIFESGVSRGVVGSGWTDRTTYLVRITLTATGAVYEIQGGVYATIGGVTWTNITPGTTSSTASPLAVGAAISMSGSIAYIGDIRVYDA